MRKPQNIHFIGLGDPGMADLACILAKNGDQISGSIEGLTEEVRSKLLKVNLVQNKVTKDATYVVIGSSVKATDGELVKAKELQRPVFSLPDFICLTAENKQRVVVTGTTGKSIIALLLIHTLAFHKRKFDYFVSDVPNGRDSVISLTDAPLIIIEGQEASLSGLDSIPSFLKFNHHIGVLSDIAPGNVEAIIQYRSFEKTLPKSGIMIYNEKDPVITGLLTLSNPDVLYVPYAAHPSIREGGQDFLITDTGNFPLRAPGPNGLLNTNAAKDTLKKLGISSSMFYQAIRSFQVTTR